VFFWQGKRRYFLACLVLFLALFPSHSFAAKKRGPIIIGAGAGYSFIIDSGLRSFEVYYPRLIYLSEQLDLKNDWHFYAQYFPWRGFGFQLEFDHMRGGYNSDLKWYGTTDNTGKIIEIDYIEEPYSESWSLSSITASILYTLNLRQHARWRPYISAGVGYYFSGGDEERFYDRTKLGPEKNGSLIKLGLGVKYQITPEIGINLRGVGGTAWRREYGFSGAGDVGADQFDYAIYAMTGEVIRSENALVNSFTFLGIGLSIEFIF
jgi:hypothetical protein